MTSAPAYGGIYLSVDPILQRLWILSGFPIAANNDARVPVALFTKIRNYNPNFFTKIILRQILILRLKLHLR